MKYYSEDHEWVEVIGDEAIIGISEYAARELGEISYIELPCEDDDFIVGDILGVLESDKATCDIYAPISGSVKTVNDTLEDEPELLNESPEEKGWICRMSDIDTSELSDMMNEDAYLRYLDTL